MILLRCIISGGQAGADRGALEAAHDLGLQRGGMAPAGWRAEDGAIPEWYREGMMQSASAAYPVRTQANVEASSGTLILSFGPLPIGSGSSKTYDMCTIVGKTCRAMRIEHLGFGVGRKMLLDWLTDHQIVTLNVAGPRESREPGIQAATRAALNAILADELGFGGR